MVWPQENEGNSVIYPTAAAYTPQWLSIVSFLPNLVGLFAGSLAGSKCAFLGLGMVAVGRAVVTMVAVGPADGSERPGSKVLPKQHGRP